MPFSSREHTADQLRNYVTKNGKEESPATTDSGIPLANKDASLTAGRKGVILLQDAEFLDQMSHFDRERIPERVVHAKGSGAFGYFEVTHDITAYTAASVFSSIGKKTNIAVRFSQVAGELGAADTVRDPRGFAIKFYTDEGIWDLTGNNTPIFFIRDAILFPSFIHSQKRNPVTGLHDADAFWDFLSLRPESTHQVMFLFSDRGIPDGYRHMHGFGSNTFSLINAKGDVHYCKFHYLTNQKIRNLSPEKATEIAGRDPDYLRRDLYNNIAQGRFPQWTMYIQVMTVNQASKCNFDPFDVTKVWFHADYPLHEVGQLVLNRNPSNFFAEIEQLAFNPANLVLGIGPSPDRMLQGRLFAYGDTQRYRLGVNNLQLPVNSPSCPVQNFNRDGQQTIDNQGGAPNYHPNSFGGPDSSNRAKALQPRFEMSGCSVRYDIGEEDNFSQPRAFYNRVLNEGEQTRLINNIAGHLKNANREIQDTAADVFTKVDAGFGRRLRRALSDNL